MTDDGIETWVPNIIWQINSESGNIEASYPKPESKDPKSMAVKSDTQEDVDRLWRAVVDYNSG
jgi:predicted 3-demethylubiquinone-9 3-methyltransferase (glyoxalase superfamily)